MPGSHIKPQGALAVGRVIVTHSFLHTIPSDFGSKLKYRYIRIVKLSRHLRRQLSFRCSKVALNILTKLKLRFSFFPRRSPLSPLSPSGHMCELRVRLDMSGTLLFSKLFSIFPFSKLKVSIYFVIYPRPGPNHDS